MWSALCARMGCNDCRSGLQPHKSMLPYRCTCGVCTCCTGLCAACLSLGALGAASCTHSQRACSALKFTRSCSPFDGILDRCQLSPECRHLSHGHRHLTMHVLATSCAAKLASVRTTASHCCLQSLHGTASSPASLWCRHAAHCHEAPHMVYLLWLRAQKSWPQLNMTCSS